MVRDFYSDNGFRLIDGTDDRVTFSLELDSLAPFAEKANYELGLEGF